MGTISPRKRKNGSVAYRARVRVMRDGVTYHETETFDRRPAAATWIKQRERELAKPGVIDRVKTVDATLAKAIDRYTEESIKEIGRTKAQVLKAIKKFPIADMACSTIKSKDIIEFLQSLTSQPQTVGNYASHLAAIFAIARPMWDYQLDDREMSDAITVARRLGIISRSKQRDRRPTLAELDKLLAHFIDRRKRAPQAMPMHKVVVFALFSTRRQEEITRIAWDDFQKEHKRVLVRDMKRRSARSSATIPGSTCLRRRFKSSTACPKRSRRYFPTPPMPSPPTSHGLASCLVSRICIFTICAMKEFRACLRWA